MGKPQRRKRNHSNNKFNHRRIKAKHLTRDVDQVFEDIQPENIEKFENMEVDEELPGLGQNYCKTCAKHFVNNKALVDHEGTKFHKRMIKQLKTEPHNHKSAELYGRY